MPLDFLWVYVYWKKTGSFFNGPVKLRRSLQVEKDMHTTVSRKKTANVKQYR